VHRNYLVIVSPPFSPSISAPSATVRNFAAKANDSHTDISKVVVFDLENKFVAYSGTYTDGIRDIFSSEGQIYLLSNDGKVCTSLVTFRLWLIESSYYV
jgi:vacuolar protein sorting-associated protein 11